MKTRRIVILVSIAALAGTLLAACGSSSNGKVPGNAIAVVGSQVVLRSQFDQLMTQEKAQYKTAKKAFPAVGSSAYETLRDQIVTYLVQSAGVDQEAANMGIKVTDAQVNSYIQSLIKEKFKGDPAKYFKELKKENLTEAELKDGIRKNLLSQAVQTAVVAKVQVSKNEIKQYYDGHQSAYKIGRSRDVSHILVKTKAKAESIYKQLQGGADFATLAKKYSTDSSKTSGGKLGVEQASQLVKPFADALFALKTNAFSAPVKTIYGWHIIRANGPIVAPHTETLAEATSTIQSTLLQQKQQAAITAWVSQAHKYADDHTRYAQGFAPPTTTTSSTSTVATATT